MRSKIILTISILVVTALLVFGGWYFIAKPKNTSDQSSTPPSTTSTNPANSNQPGSSTTQPPKTYKVSVYFSKHPDSDDDPSKTFPVSRTSSDLGVAKFAITELLKGPSASEVNQGFFTTARLRDSKSTCSGKDFTLSIANNSATLKFCKQFDHLGVVADGQAESEIKATLLQFSSVKKVIILNPDGNCEFNLSGQNLCLQ